MPCSTTGTPFVSPTESNLIYQEYFDNDNTGWIFGNFSCNLEIVIPGWQIGVPNYYPFWDCGGNPPCMGTSLNSIYGRSQIVYALSPQIIIPTNEILNISFLLAYKFGQNPFDGSNLMFSTNLKNWSVLGNSSDGGLNWYNRISILDLSNINDPSFPETPPSGWGYIENQNNWKWVTSQSYFSKFKWTKFIMVKICFSYFFKFR